MTTTHAPQTDDALNVLRTLTHSINTAMALPGHDLTIDETREHPIATFDGDGFTIAVRVDPSPTAPHRFTYRVDLFDITAPDLPIYTGTADDFTMAGAVAVLAHAAAVDGLVLNVLRQELEDDEVLSDVDLSTIAARVRGRLTSAATFARNALATLGHPAH